jgi:hypothetical protein
VARSGDILVIPIHDTAIGQQAIRIHSSGLSVLAVSQNPETSASVRGQPDEPPRGSVVGYLTVV